MIIHIDCDSFYASCEVSLRPDLQGKPVVCANCNEAGGGIILALTKEAKALGLKRGNPVFQVKDILNKHDVAVFPVNLPKYVDISRRLMQVVRDQELVLNLTQYSVDEFFGELPLSDPAELRQCAERVSKHITKCTGIPVSCGISHSFTLAKVATWYAKHFKGYGKICVLPMDKVEVALKGLPIADVWGIGRRTAPKLQSCGVSTALDFYMKSEREVRRLLNVNGLKTWKELHGEESIDIESLARQKSILHSRTFTYMTGDIEVLKGYVADYSVAVSRKLRDQHSVCMAVTTFLSTNPHREDLDQYSNSHTVRLSVATADTMVIAKAAEEALERAYLKGYQYKRAGVILNDITTDNAIQLDLFESDTSKMHKSKALMSVIDAINTKYGMNALRIASQSEEEKPMDLTNFQPLKNETTNINDIIQIK